MSDRLVTVATYQFLPEAEAARMFLQEEGVRVFLADAETVNMDWLLGNAIGNIKLQVASSEAERASGLLKELGERAQERAETEWNLEEDEDAPLRCLSCSQLMDEEATQCKHCGWSYEEGSDG